MKTPIFLFVFLVVPSCLFAATTSLSFDSFSPPQGSPSFDSNYGATIGTQYQTTYTDSTAGVDMRVTMIDLVGPVNGTNNTPRSYDYGDDSSKTGSSGDNATMGIRTSQNDFPAHAHFQYEFFLEGTNTPFKSDFLLTVYDIDLSLNKRREEVLIPTAHDTVFRFADDGTTTTDEYTGTLGAVNPDTNGTSPLDKTYVERASGTETFNGTEFRAYTGLGDFQDNEGSENASPMGAITVSLQDIDMFEMILRITNTNANNNQDTGARFILDFTDPPDSPNITVPESGSFVLAAILGITAWGVFRFKS